MRVAYTTCILVGALAGAAQCVVATPLDMPVTTPVAADTIATLPELLLHKPPEDGSLNANEVPIHTEVSPPDIADGIRFTV